MKIFLFDFFIQHKELKKYLFATNIKDLKLDEFKAIGYTYKCLGAGFWALKQNDFRKALQKVTMEVRVLYEIYSSSFFFFILKIGKMLFKFPRTIETLLEPFNSLNAKAGII